MGSTCGWPMPSKRLATVRGLTSCLAAAILALTLTACDESQYPASGASAPASGITQTGTPPAPASPAAGGSRGAAADAPRSGAEPTLGTALDPGQRGYGQVRPSEIDNGGDPTGIVTKVHWTSWGGAQATGDGIGYYVPEDAPVAESRQEPAHIVAFELGTCQGKLMYQRIAWYFPSKGDSFDPKQSRNICTGD